jgi:hypothetical protein
MEVLLVALGAAVVSAGIAGGLTAWWCGRTAARLRARLEKVEQARAAAHERSTQARQQIQQLSHAIARHCRAAAPPPLGGRPAGQAC